MGDKSAIEWTDATWDAYPDVVAQLDAERDAVAGTGH